MRVRRRTLVTLGALAAAATAIVGVWNLTPLVPSEVSRLLTDNLLRERGYRLELDAVRGTLSGQVLFLHPRLVALADSSAVILRADALRVRMRQPWNVLHGRVTIESLRLERPRIELPALQAGGAGRGVELPTAGFPRLTIDALEITHGRVMRRTLAGSPELLVDSLDTTLGLRSRPQQMRVVLQTLSAGLPADSLRIAALTGDFTWRADTLKVKDLHLRTAATAVSGNVDFFPAKHAGRAILEARPADLLEITRLLHQPPHHGQLSGGVRLRWQGVDLEAQGDLSGAADDFRLQDLEFDVAAGPAQIAVRSAKGLVNDTRIVARVEYGRQNAAMAGEVSLEEADLSKLVPARFLPAAVQPLPAHELTGTVRFRRGGATDSLHVDVEIERSRVQDVRIVHVDAHFDVGGHSIRVASAELESSLGRVRASGRVRGDSLDADFDVATPHVEGILARLHRPGPTGDVAVQGRLSGAWRSPDVEAEIRFGALQYAGATLWGGTLGAWGRVLGREQNLDLELRADSLQVGGHTLRTVAADGNYAAPLLRITRSQATSGDTLVAAAASIESKPEDWNGAPVPSTRLRLETALLRVQDAEFRVEDRATIWWHGQAVHVDSLQLVTRGGSLGVRGDVDATAHTIAGRAELAGVDFEFLRRLLHLRQEISGIASGWVEAHGNLGRTRLDGYLAVSGGRFNGLAFDSLSVAIGSEDAGTELQAVRLVTPHGSLRGRVRIGLLPPLERWFGGASARESLHDLGQAEIAGAFELAELDLGELWRARAPEAPPSPWAARLSSSLTLAGRVGEPRIEMRGLAHHIHVSTVEVDSVQFDLGYADEVLALRSLDLNGQGQVLHADGKLPARLDLLRGLTVFRDRPLEAEVLLPHSSFAIADRFIPVFEPPPAELPRGAVEGSIQVRGTLESPELKGGFRVDAAAFMLRDLEEVYRDVYATGQFDGKTLRITELRGSTGSKGTITGTGELEFANLRLSDYRFKMDLKEVTVRSVPEMTAVVTGHLDLRGAHAGHGLIPDLRGTADVLRGEIRQEFSSSSSQSQVLVTDVPLLLADVTVRADKGNVWIRNSVVDAELQGNLRVLIGPFGTDVQGQVRVKRGTYSYLVQRFDIKRGDLDFSKNAGFNPELNIEGQRGRPGQRVYVTLTGSAMAPQLSFRSDRAEESSDEIQQQLLSFSQGAGTSATANALADYAEQTLRDLALLRDVSIDPALKDETGKSAASSGTSVGYNVSAGREISDRVFLVYTQGVNSDLSQRVAVEVDINRWLLMESSYERRSVTQAGINQSQNQYDINLKYRHEY